jgi:NAD(P)H-dependent FMN reductase
LRLFVGYRHVITVSTNPAGTRAESESTRFERASTISVRRGIAGCPQRLQSEVTGILDRWEVTAMSTLAVIIGSTRPGRAGLPIGQWFADRATADGRFSVEVTDLAELELPLLDEPNHPRLRQYTHGHTKEWSERIDRADAVVIVTPEYNHGYPASVKNALDYLHQEWANKPIGFVSYGGVSGGTRAVQQLKQVVAGLRMVPVVEAVAIPFHSQLLDEDGALQSSEPLEQAADAMLAELSRLAAVLQPERVDADRAA